MSKVLVDRELLERVCLRQSIGMHWNAIEELEGALAQPAEVDGVEVVALGAWRLRNLSVIAHAESEEASWSSHGTHNQFASQHLAQQETEMSEHCPQPQAHPARCGCEEVDIARINYIALQGKLATAERNAAYWKEQYQALRNDYQQTLNEKHAEAEALQAEGEALRPALALLRVMRTHTDEPTGHKYPVSMWFPQIDALEAAMAAKEGDL